ncbi:DUF4013 domain-containing protein, partial [Methanobrevibacter sp. OttesenSCG-928-K11]|nr:DUF4013 domain-containing protein [Methanobrevibacter sp. OttesenSCG-928-K11]
DIFKESLVYPTKNWDKLLILGVLIIIANLVTVMATIGIELQSIDSMGIILGILAIVGLIISIIVGGYSFSIIKDTINNLDTLPEFEFLTNFVDGLKVFVVSIVYYLIPTIITLIIAYLTGVFDNIVKILPYVNGTTVPETLITNLAISSSVTFIIGIILMIIFTLLLTIAIPRMADKDSFGEAFAFKKIFNTIGDIGWGNYIVWYILLVIILMVISWITALITFIPIIGMIIALIFINPFITIFSSRALGLIYNEKD